MGRGGGLQDMVTQDEIVLHGRGEGGPDPMQDILHDSFEKQAALYHLVIFRDVGSKMVS